MDYKIINPKTGKPVKRNGEIGRCIEAQYIEEMKKSAPRGQDVTSLAAATISKIWSARLLKTGFTQDDIEAMSMQAARKSGRVSKPIAHTSLGKNSTIRSSAVSAGSS